MPKIFVSTAPFGEIDHTPIELLERSGLDYTINPLGRKLKPEEIGEMAKDCDGLIAGTEKIDIVLRTANKLQIIVRVGIGLDSVPLEKCRKQGITLAYTPDAVTKAVVELTIGLMVSGPRQVALADRQLRRGEWYRLQGKRVGESIIGLIGFGRIGSNVARLLAEFQPREVLINDLKDKSSVLEQLRQEKNLNIRQVSKEEIYQHADIVSLHVPLSPKTRNLICEETIQQFRQKAFLLNTARGGIVNEQDLYQALQQKRIAGAAVDVFEKEPYSGPLAELENVILTQHMGSCSYDCRRDMEVQATEEIIRF
ncbi:MAG: phosphoglycerate dehydrogenase, partial [SAR324 cluster bacterium]|nr:phosphoglycerate dehydrogenase [SAR324 cluster bacterium]